MASDHLCQVDMKSVTFAACWVLVMVVGGVVVAQDGQFPRDPVDLLVTADELAQSDPASMLRSLELLHSAGGRVFTFDGRPADLGYDELYGKVHAALSLPGTDPVLRDRFASLPAPLRGHARGWIRAEVPAIPIEAHDMTFRGGEPAIIYARAGRAIPIALTVTDARGRKVCSKRSKKGRALCRWEPRATMKVRVRIASGKFDKTDTVAIFTN